MAAGAGPSFPGCEKRGWPRKTGDHVTGKMAVFPWHSRNRNYKAELASCRLETVPLECGDYHPLKPITVTESKTKKVSRKGSTSSTSSSSSSSVVDPLSSVLDGTDPLSMFAATSDPAATVTVTESSRKKRDKDENSFVGPDFEPWASKRGEILARYTTTEKLSINLFMGSEKGRAGAAASAMSEKVRTRLEELDDFEEGSQKELLNLTQQDYVNRIEELNQSLKDAWASDQKVKALKIVIQDTMEFIRSFQSEAPLKRGVVSAQDASLQERVLAQLRAALYGIHDIFFVMDAAERMSILHHDREARKEKLLRQMDKMKSPRVALSVATQKSLDRKKFMKVAEMGMPNKKFLLKQNPSETRVLQPNQGQNAPVHRLLSRQGSICRKNPKKAAKCCDNLRRQHSLG